MPPIILLDSETRAKQTLWHTDEIYFSMQLPLQSTFYLF